MLKKITKSAAAAKLAAFLIKAYIRLVHATSRWQFTGKENFEAGLARGKGVILVFWHGRLLMAPMVRRETDRRVYMLVSAHRDGEIIANAVRPFGIDFIRGSAANRKKPGQNKSGAPAILQMTAALEAGDVVGMTPDGPRGPAERVQPGVVRLAMRTGASIVPAAYSVSNGRQLGTWDRFLLAGPFSRGVYVAGEPIEFSTHGEMPVERAMEIVEKALTTITAKADEIAGRKTK